MLVTIHQPNYLPWPGFFHKWLLSDAFIVLDTVQFHKNEWQNRNRIKSLHGPQWVTVPVSFSFPDPIQDVQVSPGPWARKQIAAIEQAYARAPYLDRYWPELKVVIESHGTSLCALNVALIRLLGEMCGCSAPLYLASDMRTSSQDSTQRLVGLCKELDADGYLSGREGRHYLDRQAFAEAGIALYFQEVEPPVYPQLHGDFVPCLSVLDLLFNVGPEAPALIRAMGGIRYEKDSGAGSAS